MEDINIYNAKTKAEVLKAEADLLMRKIMLLAKEYVAANESAEPLQHLNAAAHGCQTVSLIMQSAIDGLWD